MMGLLLATLVASVLRMELAEAMVLTTFVEVVVEFVLFVEFVLMVFVVVTCREG